MKTIVFSLLCIFLFTGCSIRSIYFYEAMCKTQTSQWSVVAESDFDAMWLVIKILDDLEKDGCKIIYIKKDWKDIFRAE